MRLLACPRSVKLGVHAYLTIGGGPHILYDHYHCSMMMMVTFGRSVHAWRLIWIERKKSDEGHVQEMKNGTQFQIPKSGRPPSCTYNAWPVIIIMKKSQTRAAPPNFFFKNLQHKRTVLGAGKMLLAHVPIARITQHVRCVAMHHACVRNFEFEKKKKKKRKEGQESNSRFHAI